MESLEKAIEVDCDGEDSHQNFECLLRTKVTLLLLCFIFHATYSLHSIF